MNSKRFVQGKGMGHCSAFSIRCDHPYLTQGSQRLGKQSQAGRMNSIVVGDENAQMFARHKKSCTGAASFFRAEA